MRKLLIVLALLPPAPIVGCFGVNSQSEATTASSRQSKELVEATAAAKAYYEKAKKDCGTFGLVYVAFGGIVIYRDAEKEPGVVITDHAIPAEGLEWRATAHLRAAAWNPIGVTGRALGWKATGPDHAIPAEGVMIEKKDGQITYDIGHTLSQVKAPPNPCN